MNDPELEPMIEAFVKRTTKTARTLVLAFVVIALLAGSAVVIGFTQRPGWSIEDSIGAGVYTALFCLIPGLVIRGLLTKDSRRAFELRKGRRLAGELTDHVYDQIANIHYLHVSWVDGAKTFKGVAETPSLDGPETNAVTIIPIRGTAMGIVMGGVVYLGNISR